MLFTGLRAEAAQARALGLALLASDFGRRIAAAKHSLRGDELVAALAALHDEHCSAEKALTAKLSREARDRRRTMLAALRPLRKVSTTQFRNAALAVTRRARPQRPDRPRRRARSTGRVPRPRR